MFDAVFPEQCFEFFGHIFTTVVTSHTLDISSWEYVSVEIEGFDFAIWNNISEEFLSCF